MIPVRPAPSVAAAARLLDRRRAVGTRVRIDAAMTPREVDQRAEMIAMVIRARSKLQQLRNRA